LSIKSAASEALSSSKAAMVAFAHSKNHESGSLKLHVRTNDDLYMTVRNFGVKRFPLRHIGDLRRNRNTGTHWIGFEFGFGFGFGLGLRLGLGLGLRLGLGLGLGLRLGLGLGLRLGLRLSPRLRNLA
jgi:hypothetical protein